MKFKLFAVAMTSALLSSTVLAEVAYKVGGKSYTVSDVEKDNRSDFYEFEKKKFQLIERAARETYLNSFWEKMAKTKGKTVKAAREEYIGKNVKVSDALVKSTLEQFKDNPQLQKMSKSEQKQQIRAYLEERDTRAVLEKIFDDALRKKELVIVYPEPVEPRYDVKVVKTDHVKYGPKSTDTKPISCKGDDCITIVEYSEFECPFCSRVQPDVTKVLNNYRGKVRWIVRDWPLSFHDRARPAAIASHCAAEQDKYWEMYSILFENQRRLQDPDLISYAKAIGLDMKKYDKCVKNPSKANSIINENFLSGQKYGVTGTPAFFINGRRFSGAIPYAQFKQIIDQELATKK